MKIISILRFFPQHKAISVFILLLSLLIPQIKHTFTQFFKLNLLTFILVQQKDIALKLVFLVLNTNTLCNTSNPRIPSNFSRVSHNYHLLNS